MGQVSVAPNSVWRRSFTFNYGSFVPGVFDWSHTSTWRSVPLPPLSATTGAYRVIHRPQSQLAMDVTVVSITSKKRRGAVGNQRVIADTIEISSEEDEAKSVSLMNLEALKQTVRNLKKVRISCVITLS